MNHIDYLEKAVSFVQREAFQPEELVTLGEVIMTTWNNLEKIAEGVHYDVFHPSVSIIADYEMSLIQLLYRIPGETVAKDIAQIKYKDREYGSSWLKRGGSGAFHAAARKPDRIENQLKKCAGNLLVALTVDSREEGIRDDLGDLRRYMILWRAYRLSRGHR
jgi:hypothetical protein